VRTILGLVLLAAELLKPRQQASPAEPQRKAALPKAMLRWMNAAETTTVALWAAITVPLTELWAHSMTEVYSPEPETRCSSLAMSNFAATGIRTVLLVAGMYWLVSASLRWSTERTAMLPFCVALRLTFLLAAFLGFMQMVARGQIYVEYLPASLPSLENRVACREFLSGPKGSFERWIERQLFPPSGVPVPLRPHS
jgi:hypothetical protein